MKKYYALIVLAFLGLSLSAQITTEFPAYEGFNTDWSQGNVILHVSDGWRVDWQPEHPDCPISFCVGDYFIYAYDVPPFMIKETMETYAFFTSDDYLRIQFLYANPSWLNDVDHLIVGYRHSIYDAYVPVLTIEEPHDNWVKEEIILPGGVATQLCFTADTYQGYGVYIDCIEITTFNTTDLEEHVVQSVKVYPNPAKDKLYVEGAEGELVKVYDGMGRLVMEQRYTGNLDVSQLAQGIYALSVGERFSRFMKE